MEKNISVKTSIQNTLTAVEEYCDVTGTDKINFGYAIGKIKGQLSQKDQEDNVLVELTNIFFLAGCYHAKKHKVTIEVEKAAKEEKKIMDYAG